MDLSDATPCIRGQLLLASHNLPLVLVSGLATQSACAWIQHCNYNP